MAGDPSLGELPVRGDARRVPPATSLAPLAGANPAGFAPVADCSPLLLDGAPGDRVDRTHQVLAGDAPAGEHRIRLLGRDLCERREVVLVLQDLDAREPGGPHRPPQGA